MKLPKMRYVTTARRDYLELYSFDGTYRGVSFQNEAAADAALSPGRAEIDCCAIAEGLLPVGATLVSRARVSEDVMQADPELCSGEDPLGTVRLRFSMSLLVKRSEYITKQRDACARARNPASAKRYDQLVETITSGRYWPS